MSVADARWWQRLTWPVRRLRWHAASWSTEADRQFHDELFGAQDYDPFSRSYPGYTLTDLERFFAGYALDVRGTMAGLEIYGPSPHGRSALGDRFGDISYELAVAHEDALYEQGLDLALKHWAILADRSGGSGGASRLRSRLPRPRAAHEPVMPAYAVTYHAFDGPAEVSPGEVFQARLRLFNAGWLPWDSRGDKPVMVSYHWHDATGRTLVEDGVRTPFPQVVNPGESVEAVLRVEAPDTSGRLTLVVDLVHEGAAWFSDAGVVPLRQPIRVQPRR